MNSLLSQDSFDRFVRLVRTLVPDAAGFALCNLSGQAAQFLDFDSTETVLPAIAQLCDRDPDWVSNQECCQLRTVPGTRRVLLTAGLCDHHRAPVAALALLMPGDTQQKAVAPLLTCVIEFIEHEIALTTELDAMTIELTERYEELNLVYHTEDQVNYFRQGREALKDLTQNCLDYLNVGMAVLNLKDKGIIICCNHPNEPIANVPLVNKQLAAELYSWVKDNRTSVVINDMSDPLAIALVPGVPYRILCCPVLDHKGDVAGILATVNNYSKAAFSNSDKNLMQVMSRKASKIIAANYDDLTGLINRNGYEYYLDTALLQAQTSDLDIGLLHVNIDQLHVINDTVSHAAGDAVIRSVAATLASQKRDCDSLSRLGGDEFGLLLHDCSFSEARKFAERARRKIEASTICFKGQSFGVTVSIGVAMLSSTTESASKAVGYAELACTVAKDHGQNRVETYCEDNIDMVRREEQMRLVGHIQKALVEDRFELYGQPIQALVPGTRLHHTEILLRLLDENGEIFAPGNFIPAAERYHIMPSVDRWVVKKTLKMLSEYDEDAIRGGIFAINLSGQSFNDKDFLKFVHAEFQNSRVPPECICFEITETAAVANLVKAARFMDSLREVGCSFSLDDFGSGISSFGYLKSLPVNYLKIDGSIVRDIVTDKVSAAMVTAINEVGHTMRLRTIAEFVENDAIKSCLEKIGVDYVQGYGIGRPELFSGLLSELMTKQAAVAS